MQFANSGLDSSRQRLRSTLTSFCGLLPALSALMLTNLPANAAERVTPVKLWVAGKYVPLKSTAVYDGKETFVPLEALASVGATGVVTTRKNVVRVTLRSGKKEDLDYATYKGRPYISLTDLAETVDGKVLKPSKVREGDIPPKFVLPNTSYLLARVTDVHVEGSSLHVGTSFPVPYKARMLKTDNLRGYVDVVGATISKDMHTVSLKSTRYAERVRFGQNTPSTARIVVELAPGARIASNDTTRASAAFVTPLTGGSSRTGAVVAHETPIASSSDDNEFTPPPRARRRVPVDDTMAPEPTPTPRKKKLPPVDTSADAGTVTSRKTRNVDTGVQDSTVSPTPATRKRVIDVERIAYRSDDRNSIQLVVSTSSKARAFVHYSSETRQGRDRHSELSTQSGKRHSERSRDHSCAHHRIDGFDSTEIAEGHPAHPNQTRCEQTGHRLCRIDGYGADLRHHASTIR